METLPGRAGAAAAQEGGGARSLRGPISASPTEGGTRGLDQRALWRLCLGSAGTGEGREWAQESHPRHSCPHTPFLKACPQTHWNAHFLREAGVRLRISPEQAPPGPAAADTGGGRRGWSRPGRWYSAPPPPTLCVSRLGWAPEPWGWALNSAAECSGAASSPPRRSLCPWCALHRQLPGSQRSLQRGEPCGRAGLGLSRHRRTLCAVKTGSFAAQVLPAIPRGQHPHAFISSYNSWEHHPQTSFDENLIPVSSVRMIKL